MYALVRLGKGGCLRTFNFSHPIYLGLEKSVYDLRSAIVP